MSRILTFLIVCALAGGAQEPYPILKIQVEGNSRFSQEAIIQASGLKPGTKATPPDFEAACQRLAGTGLFTSARYRYRPAGAAFDVTLIVEESQDLREIRIELADIDEARVWSWLEQNEPLVKKEMPANDPATAYYCRAIERFLAGQGKQETIVSRFRTDSETGAVTTILRPAEMPRIAAVKFEGTQAIAAATLETALARVAVGSEYTERAFRELLDFNVRRLYDDEGRMGVRFRRIGAAKDASGALTITTAVEEGPVYRVGTFEIAGDRLPIDHLKSVVDMKPGEVASWKKIVLNMEKIRSALGRDGYLDASCDAEKQLDSVRAIANVTVLVEKGPQSRFGALRLDGLAGASAVRARSLWKLAAGAVLNTDLVDQFERALMRDDQVRFKRIARRYEPGAVAGAMDVVFTFH